MEDFRLKVFRAVATRLNFTQAAEALYLTQPAVTLQIKSLEEALGVRLFDRTGSRVSLTPAGAVLLRYAEQIGALYAEAEREIGRLGGEERGPLLLGASTTIAQYLLPRLAGEFAAAHPRIELFIKSANTEAVVTALSEGRIALGLIEGPAGRGDLKVEPFIEDEIVMIVSASHEWAHSTEPLRSAALVGVPLIMRERGSGTRRVVESALKKAGLKLRALTVAMELDSTEAIKSGVEAGLGVGFVSRRALIKEQQLGTLAIVTMADLRVCRRFQFIYPQGPEPDGVAGAFLRFARNRRPHLTKP